MDYQLPSSLIEDRNSLQKFLKKSARSSASITKNLPRFIHKQMENRNASIKNWKLISGYTALITQLNGKIIYHSQNSLIIYEYRDINRRRCRHLKSCLEHSLWTSPQHFHASTFPPLRNASVILLE